MAVYEGEYTSEISFPLGGIGTGSVGLAGNGRLIDWEIFNRPNKGSDNGYTHIAVKAEDAGGVIDARVLCGDVYHGFTGQYGKNYGHGLPNSSMAAFPHFGKCTFDGRFPIARLVFDDRNFPGRAVLTAFNPFIPLNDTDSGIPAAFFEIEIDNDTGRDIAYTTAFSIRNPFQESCNLYSRTDCAGMIRLTQKKFAADEVEYGDLCLAADTKDNGCEVYCQQYWYRGSWADRLETYWRNFTGQGGLKNRIYDTPQRRYGCACRKMQSSRRQKSRVPLVLTWNIPNCYNYWSPYRHKNEDGTEGGHVTWKNYYAVLFRRLAGKRGIQSPELGPPFMRRQNISETSFTLLLYPGLSSKPFRLP